MPPPPPTLPTALIRTEDILQVPLLQAETGTPFALATPNVHNMGNSTLTGHSLHTIPGHTIPGVALATGVTTTLLTGPGHIGLGDTLTGFAPTLHDLHDPITPLHNPLTLLTPPNPALCLSIPPPDLAPGAPAADGGVPGVPTLTLTADPLEALGAVQSTVPDPNSLTNMMDPYMQMVTSMPTPLNQKAKADIPCPHVGCNSLFTLRSNMRRHYLLHSQPPPFGCNICGSKFHRRADRDGHVKKHTGERNIPCGVCGRMFSRQSDRRSHEKSHTVGRRFPCGHGCEAHFTRR